MIKLTLLNATILAKMQKDIYEFRTTFGLPVDKIIEDADDTLHTSLIVEELTELFDASVVTDSIDAVIDSAYVLMGRFVQMQGRYPISGLDTRDVHDSPELYLVDILLQVAKAKSFDFEACWDEVHRSNMSKVCVSHEQCHDNVKHYNELGIDVDVYVIGSYYVLKCANDHNGVIKPGKVIKSIYYSPADFTKII
ncbi:NTP-PPase [Shewanella sp. phage 1/44]|uniref:nucleotide pyrophosphohydrolase n=1 Tax=Shewanella sp. phage 1/44 TaxID=1458862 RepID=UPI0004F7075C|nr:nucleotide pyrophosphohydrolase [Shewanella sp. phage 1/44]AHK11777.1 NTP-PPase [Shewanella sp. phage 1/44]